MLNRILKQFQGDGLKSNLMRGGLASIAIKIFGLGFSLLTAIVLARTLGPEQYGVYSYVLAIVSILAIPAMFGLPALIVRETAKAEVKQEWGLMRGLWSWANRITASLSVLIAVIAAVVLWLNRDSFSQIQFLTFAWGIAFIPLSALAALRGASLRGLRKVIQGQLPEQVLRPLLFIVALVVVSLLGNIKITAASAMMFNALSAGVAFIFGAWLLLREKPKQFKIVTKEYDKKAWSNSVVPLAMVSGLDIILQQTDIVMLGLLGTNEDVGLYRVAVQGAMLLVIGTEAVKAITMPYLVKYYSQNNSAIFKIIITKSTRVGFLFSLIIFLIFIFFVKYILRSVFGEDYVDSYYILILLSLGQLVHTFIGIVGSVLNMCGYEKSTLYSQLIAVFLNVTLNIILIPLYGIEGAAIATLTSIIVRKILLWYIAYKYLRVDTSIIGFEPKKRL